MTRKNIIATIALILIIILTFLLFFGVGTTYKADIKITSFVFIILTEMLTYGNVILLFSNKLNTFAKVGFCSTLFLYLISVILVNIIFISLFTTLKGIIVMNFSLFVVYLLIDTIIVFFKKEG